MFYLHFHAFQLRIAIIIGAVSAAIWLVELARAEISIDACRNDSPRARLEAREAVRDLFYHGYMAYKRNALNRDELRPLSCSGIDTFGGVAVTIIDTLDTLAVVGDWKEFTWAVKYVERTVPSFNIQANVSVFETTIRVLGGLLSAHGLLTDAADVAGYDRRMYYPDYNNGLLHLAVDLAERLMPAFETRSGIPYGSVGLHVGVWPGETTIASVAAAGGLLVEFGTLSRYTGDPRYYDAAFRAMEALHSYRAWTGLVGNHLDTMSGSWIAQESGIGALVDSYYEYMIKAYVLFGDDRLIDMFWNSYVAIKKYIYHSPWYLNVDMFTGRTTSFTHCSLGAFWPGLQVLLGDINDAIKTTRAHYSVWRRYGCLPEKVNVLSSHPIIGAVNYPLRPELLESVFYLHWATNDTSWVGVALSMMHSLENLTRVDCGFARIRSVASHEKEDIQDSFFLSETLKYMYIIFDDEHWLRSGRFVFSTEAHPLLIQTSDTPGVPQYALGRQRLSPLLKELRSRPGGGSKLKCPRRSRVSGLSSCGLGMPGTDHPFTGISSTTTAGNGGHFLRSTELPPEDVDLVQRWATGNPDSPVAEGDVIFGRQNAYRVLRTATNGEVLLGPLDEWEANQERRALFQRQAEEVRRRLVAAGVSEGDWNERRMTPALTFPHVLAAADVWRGLEMCF